MTTDDPNLRTIGDRIEVLLSEIGTVGDSHVQAKAEEVVRLLMEFYGAGLDRMLAIVDHDGAAERLWPHLVDDPLVATLLILHGLHPIDLETRVQQALDRVRPYLDAHGGNVQLVEVAGGVVRLRLEGNCHGCSSSRVTMQQMMERTIEEAAPDVTKIEVDGEPEPTTTPVLLQIEKAGSRICH